MICLSENGLLVITLAFQLEITLSYKKIKEGLNIRKTVITNQTNTILKGTNCMRLWQAALSIHQVQWTTHIDVVQNYCVFNRWTNLMSSFHIQMDNELNWHLDKQNYIVFNFIVIVKSIIITNPITDRSFVTKTI